MRVLLVQARFPYTYWGFQYALPMTGRRAALPPLGLVSLAALLPEDWDLRLVDLNVEDLGDDAILESDVVFVSGMHVQVGSMRQVASRACALGRPVAAGGPAATTAPEAFAGIDVVFRGEAEGRAAELEAAVVDAVAHGPGHSRVVLDAPPARPTMAGVPVPRFDLLDLSAYSSMAIQCSRGCPFSCEFCDIIEIFGRVPRLKSPDQVEAEMQALFDAGWRGPLFVVDDNFIGNPRRAADLLDRIGAFQASRGYPFELTTEASVNLAREERLVEGMRRAGFAAVFLGIETPSVEALADSGKSQNLRCDLSSAVLSLTRAGLEVMGGFIVGFDSDRPEVFEAQRRFIADLPIPMAMVGVLTALPGTALSRRLRQQGRLRDLEVSDQFGRPNFAPTMDEETLLLGYRGLLSDLYSVDAWYDRCEAFLETASRLPGRRRPTWDGARMLARAAWRIGVLSPRRRRFWRLIGKALLHARHAFPWAVARGIVGEHMIRYTEEHVLPRLEQSIADLREERAADTAA